MKSRLLFSLLVFICLFGTTASTVAQDERFKAIFIYNFTKYINWPVSQGDFVINVLGNDGIIHEIDEIATKKTVGNSKIDIIRILTPSEIKKCQILFVASNKMDLLSEVIQIAKKNNILVITEKANACKEGSCINFLSRDGKLTFEISKLNIETCGLQVSVDLLKLGIAVDN
jgi:formate dehydrogenase assembly factor FdhD